MLSSEKIIVDSKLRLQNWTSLLGEFWPLKESMLLTDLFCKEICEAYQAHIKSQSREIYCFNQKDIFELKESLRPIEDGKYEIRLELPNSVYLALSSNRLRLLDELFVGASVQNRKGEILYTNKAAQKIYGRNQEVVGSSIIDSSWQIQDSEGKSLAIEDLPSIKTIVENRAIEKEIIAIYNPQKKDRIWLQVSCTPILINGIQLSFAAQTVFADVTERINLNYKYQRFLNEEDFVLKLGNKLLEKGNTDFQFQEEFILSKIGAHCEADLAFIVDIQNLEQEKPLTSSWFKEGISDKDSGALINSFIFSELNRSFDWRVKPSYQVDRISLVENKDQHLELLAEHQIESLLYLPIILGERLTGFLMLHRKINGRTFKENDQYLLKRVTELLISLFSQNISNIRAEESFTKLNRLSASISEVVWLVNLNLEATYVSSSVKSVLGIEPEEFLRDVNSKALQTQLKAKLSKALKDFKASAAEDNYSLAIQTPFKKENKTLLLSHKVIGDYDEMGELSGLIICTSDETELHKTFLQLQENEDKYRSLFENSTLGLTIIDNGKIIDCNEAAAKILKYQVHELKQKSPADLSPKLQPNGESSKKLSAELIQKALTGEPQRFEWLHLDANSKEVIIAIELKAIRTENKTLLLASWLDVSENRSNSDKLIRLSAAVENSPVSMVITNTKAEIEYVNPAAEKITGYTKEELLGKNPRVLQSGLTPTKDYNAMWAALLDGKEWQGIFHNKKKNGELYWEKVHISPVKNRLGVVSHYLAIKEDITGIKQYLETIEKQNEILKDIAWTESHILRAPLSRQLGLIQFYKEKNFDSEFTESRVLQLIEDAAAEMDEIIGSINTKTYKQRKTMNTLHKNPLKF